MDSIDIIGAKQNNLKNIDVSFKTGQITVLTGVSGSGKSSLAFDTLYAEGQRRYVETFSPYARQFLDRMDKPKVDSIRGILPAIAIDQTNPVRNSRSSVGTMTEINDHLKLLFAKSAQLYCRCCAQPVRSDTPQSIWQALQPHLTHDPRLFITFPVPVPPHYSADELQPWLAQQGYTRIHESDTNAQGQTVLMVVQDRFRPSKADTERIMEALEAALRYGQGKIRIYSDDAQQWRFSTGLHCAHCDIDYAPANPSAFSFNSPLGACTHCKGFGRTMGIDPHLVVPDPDKTLAEGAIKPFNTPTYAECQEELMRYAKRQGVPVNIPWRHLDAESQQWVWQGDADFGTQKKPWRTQWYGVQRFFEHLEGRSYKMHVRVMLSKYRSYHQCKHCQGARLQSQALLWRLGATHYQPNHQRFMPPEVHWTPEQLQALPGLGIHDLMRLPISDLSTFFEDPSLAPDPAMALVVQEIRQRLSYLNEVGVGYLSLDRQSRTLSGGEIQRLNLTTALGTSLTNTLFVLDEPSIGLHPQDMDRIVRILQRLKKAGNTLVLVEHDPQVMMAADRLLDIGPGAGEKGGQIVFDGTPEQLRQHDSTTGNYLGARKRIVAPLPQAVTPHTPRLSLRGACENNLCHLNVDFPLNRLVCITGVSGSGKSTLMQQVLYPALRQHFKQPTETPGAFEQLIGAEQLSDVIFVDQSPIGKTTRSNPASYVGAFDHLRKLFAATPLAKQRGYTAGTFSFNSGDGRCPTCAGTGFEHIEMQFLSDVYLRCPDCDGKRFKPEILEVRVEHLGQSANLAEVLHMTIRQALDFFKGMKALQTSLQPLIDVGLDYVQLGQAVPTLSGGEAQRLKLAAHLVEAAKLGKKASQLALKGKLFLFDEPTTGLHFDDIAKLMQAFRQLLAAGHSLLIIEHNLDLIAAADWVIDLGPGGGQAGGQLVAQGNPDTIKAHPSSATGVALRHYEHQFAQAVALDHSHRGVQEPVQDYRAEPSHIAIRQAREHNLRNVSVDIPHQQFTVITGVSGSGKSTLAFDILFNEGQRRYLESLNAYARAVVQPAGKPDVDAIYGIPPTVAIEQRTSRGGHKSTVGTITEIHHFLRLLYVKLGTPYCPDCAIAVQPSSAEHIVQQLQTLQGDITLLAPLVVARKGYYTATAQWAEKAGYTHLRVDGQMTPVSPWPRLDRYQEHTIELPIWTGQSSQVLLSTVQDCLQQGKGVMSALDAKGQQHYFSSHAVCPSCQQSLREPDPRLFSYHSKHGWCTHCFGTGLQLAGFTADQSGEETQWQESERYLGQCQPCQGERLNPQARAVRWHNVTLPTLSRLCVDQAMAFFDTLQLSKREADIAHDLLQEVRSRLRFMQKVGLGYLHLDRSAPTLSGGEAQRLRLAAQLGSNLQGVCYVLDEPTIGLHPRDNRILLDALATLENNGNTLVVVEHDEDTIRRASHIIDMGPGAGVRGGTVVAQGSYADIVANPQSVTGRYLAQPMTHPSQPRRPIDTAHYLRIQGVRRHNITQLDADFALQRLNVITGVSGSGKSTLVRGVLMPNLLQALASGAPKAWRHCQHIKGWQSIDRILEVDQTPIGKTPRSCPATYIGFWDDVRQQFAQTQQAKRLGWTASRFSFNTGQGRCPTCEGQGMRTVEMNFLPDMKVPCESCHGQRFNPETLSVQLRGKSVGEVLNMQVDEAIDFFEHHPKVRRALQLLQDVGLGYLRLGQASPTLSGGEAQRLKLVSELVKARLDDNRQGQRPHTLYILDEPTVGLSMADVEKLIVVLHRLVDAGHTVLLIEHNADVMAEADWIVDMGPEGGVGGGQVVASGTPEDLVAQADRSHTGAALRPLLHRH